MTENTKTDGISSGLVAVSEVAKLRDALSETEAYHKRMVAAKDAEIREHQATIDGFVSVVATQVDRIEKQSAALKLARGAIKFEQFFGCCAQYMEKREEALAAINEVLKGE